MNYIGKQELEAAAHFLNFNTHFMNILSKEIHKNNIVYDFGAGTGLLAELFFIKNKIQPFCIEIDPELIRLLKNKNFNVATKISKKNIADVVYSSNVLEHIEDDFHALKEINSLLKRNGKLILLLPAFNFLFSQHDINVGHYRRYNKKTIINLLNTSGFLVEKYQYIDCLGGIANLIIKFKSNINLGVNVKAIKFFDTYIFPMSLFLDLFFHKIFGRNILVVAKKK